MADMQSSGITTRGWYCLNCGYGPHNPNIDVGCANCGHIPNRNRKFEQKTMVDFAAQSLTTHLMTSMASLIVAPLGPLNNSEFYPVPGLSSPSTEPFPVNESFYDAHEATCDYDQFSAPPPKPMHDEPHLMNYH